MPYSRQYPTNTQAYHAIRLKHDMPLDKLSAKTGIGPHRLDCFEMGKYEISLFHLIKIASALQTKAEHFIRTP